MIGLGSIVKFREVLEPGDETLEMKVIESLPLPYGADAGDRSMLEAYETDVLS